MKLDRLSIGARLGLSFGILLVFILAIALSSLFGLWQVRDQVNEFLQEDLVKADAASTVDTYTRANAQRTIELILAQTPQEASQAQQFIDFNRKQIDAALAVLDSRVKIPEARALVQKIADLRAEFVQSFVRASETLEKNGRESALQWLAQDTLPKLDKLRDPIMQLNELQHEVAVAGGDAAMDSVSTATFTMVLLGAAALAIGILLAYFIAQSITRPVRLAMEVAGKVAAGDLSVRVPEQRGRDEMAALLRSLQDMVASLTGIVHNVKSGAHAIATATDQIAAGNTELSSRTEQQASALLQTSASIEQISATVHQSQEYGQRAYEIAESASEVAVKGGDVVAQVVHTMEAINTSSRKISDIIGVIDSIAFQTNILALNSAVEAARAGEQGRGFAVVAGEVRTLAQRAASAASEIKTLIDTSVSHVSEGSMHVERAGSTMDEIVVSVRRVADLMKEISQASKEQSSGIDQINLAMDQIEQVTQSNSALVEEAAAAAESLDAQAHSLVSTIGVFNTGENSGLLRLG